MSNAMSKRTAVGYDTLDFNKNQDNNYLYSKRSTKYKLTEKWN